jgi:hypothetical protein
MTGLPQRTMQNSIHGFVLRKYTKPAHEHNLQVFPALRKPSSSPFTGTLKMLRHITANMHFFTQTDN